MHGTYSVTEMRGNNLQEQLKLETKHEDYKCIAKYKLTVSEAVAFILKCPHATEITMTSVYSFPGLIQLLPQDRFFCLWEEKKHILAIVNCFGRRFCRRKTKGLTWNNNQKSIPGTVLLKNMPQGDVNVKLNCENFTEIVWEPSIYDSPKTKFFSGISKILKSLTITFCVEFFLWKVYRGMLFSKWRANWNKIYEKMRVELIIKCTRELHLVGMHMESRKNSTWQYGFLFKISRTIVMRASWSNYSTAISPYAWVSSTPWDWNGTKLYSGSISSATYIPSSLDVALEKCYKKKLLKLRVCKWLPQKFSNYTPLLIAYIARLLLSENTLETVTIK